MALQDELDRMWPGWVVEEKLGEGSFGAVYRIRKDSDLGSSSYAAVKVIEIPRSRSEARSLANSGMDDSSIHAHYDEIAQRFQREIDVMLALKGAPGIVAIEEQAAVRKDDGVGWIFYIRMELLTSLVDYQFSRRTADNPQGLPSQAEVIRMGRELSESLVACHGQGIIHRDIKPDNIFVTNYGSFKLGDFGIARQLESSAGLMSTVAGTKMYMAPEIMLAEGSYGVTVDIYSLGLVLYQLSNGGRLPFAGDERRGEAAADPLTRRVSGESLPAPSDVSPELARVVLKACAHDPQDRYQSASELLADLRRVERDEEPEATAAPRARGGMEANAPQDTETHSVRRGLSKDARGIGGDGMADASVEGTRYVFHGKSDASNSDTAETTPTDVPADESDSTSESDSQPARVRGADMYAEISISATEAAKGCRKTLKLAGPLSHSSAREDVAVYVPAGTRNGQRLRCTGLGVPGVNGGSSGDLIIRVNVTPPEPVENAARKALTCPICGASVTADSAFCIKCGSRIATAAPSGAAEPIEIEQKPPLTAGFVITVCIIGFFGFSGVIGFIAIALQGMILESLAYAAAFLVILVPLAFLARHLSRKSKEQWLSQNRR